MCVCVGRGVYLAQVVKKIVNVVCEPKYELFILKIGGNTLYRQAWV